MIELKVYHTVEDRKTTLHTPVLAEGNEQWLGDGFYFWQDKLFARKWGERICKRHEGRMGYQIYIAVLRIDTDNFLDTVFCEEDYVQFVEKVEHFARLYREKFGHTPTLEDFNDFIAEHEIWTDVKAIRFQDLPENDDLVRVKGFYYKKRIQIVVYDTDIISTFGEQIVGKCR